MKTTVENYPNQLDFYDIRSELIETGRQFDASLLSQLPYAQLQFCCIGNAGAAACDPQLVQEEKRLRRQRFLSLENAEFEKCELLLRNEGMYDDVVAAICSQGAPLWRDLTNRQQAWAKTHCLWTHLDNPHPRLREARDLLLECSTTTLPNDVCRHYVGKLEGLMAAVGRLPDETLRSQLEEIRDNLRDFLPGEEGSICLKEQIADYGCTSDCFRVTV